jgi:4-hydroxybenzoate polyprenyltransferase
MTPESRALVRVTSLEGKESRGVVQLRSLGAAERAKRAAKMVGILWGLAVLSVFVPIAHFVLVPGFFLAGLVAAAMVYRTEIVVVGGEASCPKCGAAVSITPGTARWPMRETCEACQWPMTIERLEGRSIA